MPISPIVAVLPRTADSRRLAELSSYSDDLSEASHALELALEAGHQSPLWQPLTGFAVVAYMRAFTHSNVRRGLLALVTLPDDLIETHDMIRGYRNTTIAHSQSELSLSLPILTRNPDGSANHVVPITIRHDLPPSSARRIADAVDRISALVCELAQDLAAQLTAQYRGTSPATIESWPVPEFHHARADEFTGNSKRRDQQRFVAYWDIDVEPTDTGHESMQKSYADRDATNIRPQRVTEP